MIDKSFDINIKLSDDNRLKLTPTKKGEESVHPLLSDAPNNILQIKKFCNGIKIANCIERFFGRYTSIKLGEKTYKLNTSSYNKFLQLSPGKNTSTQLKTTNFWNKYFPSFFQSANPEDRGQKLLSIANSLIDYEYDCSIERSVETGKGYAKELSIEADKDSMSSVASSTDALSISTSQHSNLSSSVLSTDLTPLDRDINPAPSSSNVHEDSPATVLTATQAPEIKVKDNAPSPSIQYAPEVHDHFVDGQVPAWARDAIEKGQKLIEKRKAEAKAREEKAKADKALKPAEENKAPTTVDKQQPKTLLSTTKANVAECSKKGREAVGQLITNIANRISKLKDGTPSSKLDG